MLHVHHDFLCIMVLHHVLIIRTSRCQKHYKHLEIKENKYRKEVNKDKKGLIYSVLFDHPLGWPLKLYPNSVHSIANVIVPASNVDHEISLINRALFLPINWCFIHILMCLINSITKLHSFIMNNISSKQLNTHLHHGMYS